jgi:hypothetical protein
VTVERHRPISVRLNDHQATIECGGCSAAATFATVDRNLLVESVRTFLRDHDACRPDGHADRTAARTP